MSLLTKEQAQTIIMNAIGARHPESVAKADLEKIIKWAQNVVVDTATLTNVLRGNILVEWKDGEPRFKLSPKGKKIAKEKIEESL